jgi:SAM-dependent methyltransferase
MYRSLAAFREPDTQGKRALSISGSVDLCNLIGYEEPNIEDTTYPDVSVLDLPYDDNHFDAVLCDQVLEHVEGDPQIAMRESFRVAKPGGLVIQATCLIMPMHMEPYDFWRFTPYGLKLLAEPYGEILDASGWGHPSIVLLDLLGLRHEPIPEARWHPGNWIARANRQTWPVVTWVVARKGS